MTYDHDTCRAMMTKYLAWFKHAQLCGDCFSGWYISEWVRWNIRLRDSGGVP